MPSTKIPPGWYAKLHALTEAIDNREGSRCVPSSEVVKASRMTPRDNLARWCGPVSLYDVKDGTREFMVAVMDQGDASKPADMARCSCDLFSVDGEICAHVLVTLAARPGPLT